MSASRYGLTLSDESRWVIAAADEEASSVVSRLADAMRLRVMSPSSASLSHHGAVRRLLVKVDADDTESSRAIVRASSPSQDEGVFVAVLSPFSHSSELNMRLAHIQLKRLSHVFAREAQARGGALIHGALAERNGHGVILAGPSGVGKTTASSRLPAPWRSLCDDMTLVVRDPQGSYWAHPWPTWSRFQDGEPGGAWDVERAVRLRSIFFLSRALEDRTEPIGAGRAVSFLVECATQASMFMAHGLSKEEARSLHLERFNNFCALTRVISTHWLHLSLTGAFWSEIDRTLEGSH